MAFLDDVDICVTCVTDKPPKLPLREELVSLGVEVVYKASGVGAKAAQKNSKQAVKDFRKEAKERKRKFRLWPKSRKEKNEKQQRQKMLEKQLYKNRTSISYDAYNQRLQGAGSDDSSSLGSMESVSTLGGYGTSAGRTDHEADLLEDRDGAPINEAHDDTREPLLREAFAKGTKEPSGLAIAFASPSVVKHKTEGPLSAATSPTMSYTSFGIEDTLSSGNDDASEGSTLQKNHDTDKQLVSASGDRWWYPPQIRHAGDAEQTPQRAGGEASQSYCTPPPLPSLDGELRDKPPIIQSEPRNEEVGPWMPCGLSDMCGGGITFVDGGEDKVPNRALTITERIDSVYSNKSVDTKQQEAIRALVSEVSIVPSYEEGNGTVMDDHSENEEGKNNGPGDQLNLPPVELTPKSSYLQSRSPLDSPYSCDSRGSRGEYKEEASHISKGDFFAMVSHPSANTSEIKEVLQISPTLARARMRQEGRLPLHAACDRSLPDRFERSVSLTEVLDSLVDDLIHWGGIVTAVLLFNADACKIVDKHGDLPAHLAARRLIEWEGQWSAKLRGDWGLGEGDALKIDQLCHEMVKTIEIVLDPVLKTRGLCRKRGSIGRILPLHIACIFPISHEKMIMLLQTYPEAAGVPCDLGDLLTMIINYSLPLELLAGERVSNASGGQGESIEDGLSDLVFCFHPNVDPYRLEPERLARVDIIVKNAVRRLRVSTDNDEMAKMDAAAKAVWVWFCTFDESAEGKSFDYSNNVKNIVYSLEVEDVKLLAEEKTSSGKVSTLATPACAAIIKARLGGRAINDIPCVKSVIEQPTQISLSAVSFTSSLTTTVCIVHQQSQQAPPSEIPSFETPSCQQRSKGTFIGALMKKLFNVRENSHPTSFIILPYKLVKGGDGSLTLDTPDAAPAAIKFAQYLLEMTQPKFLKHQLEKKSVQHVSYELSVDEMEEWTLTEEKNRNILRELLDIYRTGPAYLYLLDEKDGIPLVEGLQGEKGYPIRIEDPVETIKRMLPLMLMGMIHMRGDKSLSVLVRTIIEGGRSMPESWVKTAEGVLELLYADTEDHTTVVSSTLSCKDDLVKFVCSINQDTTTCRKTTDDGYEWVVELTLLKFTLERSDIQHSFAGLKPIKLADGETSWTRNNMDAAISDVPYQMSRESELPHQMSQASALPRHTSRETKLPHQMRQALEFRHQMSRESDLPRMDAVITSDLPHQMREESVLPHQMSRETKLPHQTSQTLEFRHQMSRESDLPQVDALSSDLPHQLPHQLSQETDLPRQVSQDSAGMQRSANSFDLESILGTQSMASVDTRALDNLLSDEKPPPRNMLPPRSSRSFGRPAYIGDIASNRPWAGYLDDQSLSRSRAGSADGGSLLEESLTHSFDTCSSISSFAQSRCESMDLRQSKSWRDQLDMEEAKLEQIRAKLSMLDLADEETLSLRGEKLMDDLSQELSQYEASLTGARRHAAQDQEEVNDDSDIDEDNVDGTTKLLIRLCNLEERLLSREIDLQQIKLDLHNFELNTVGKTEVWTMTADQLEVE